MAHFVELSVINRDFIKELNPVLEHSEYGEYSQELYRIPRADFLCEVLMELLDADWDQEYDFHVMTCEILDKLALEIETRLPEWSDAEQYKGKLLVDQLKEKRETFAFESDDVLVLSWAS